MRNDVCDVCGQGGRVFEAIVPGPDGSWVRVTVHVVCENSRFARLAQQREQARWN